MSSLLHFVRLFIGSALVLSALSQEKTSDKNLSSLFEHATIISSGELQELINKPTVSVVYYFKKDEPLRRAFFREYDNSAKYLEAYNVTMAVVDCLSDKSELEHCSVKSLGFSVYTYQNGAELLVLEGDVMFDVNSIMSNILQLVLLHEVPIVQSAQERLQLQKSLAGKQDLIFSYPQALGTKGHRIFMEIAYSFQDKYAFALTTEHRSAQGLESGRPVFSMWVLFCSELESDHSGNDCRDVLYRGDYTLSAMAKFMNELSKQTLFHAPADGVADLFEMKSSLPIVYVYQNKETEREIEALNGLLAYDLRGLGKLIVVDMDNEECRKKAEQQGLKGGLPTLSVKGEDEKVTFMDTTEKLTVESMQSFVAPFIFPASIFTEDESSEQTEGVGSTDLELNLESLIDKVETQDDQVAGAVFGLSKKEMNLDLVPALTISDFYATTKKAKLLVILFYLPYDQISMAFLRDFGHASQILAENFSDNQVLARVNCFDATDLCGAENITTYPVLRIYKKNQQEEEYTGPLDAKSVVTAVKLQQLNSPLNLKTEEEVDLFLRGEYPSNFAQFTPSSVLLLASAGSKKDELIQLFKDVAVSQSSFTALAIVKDELAKAVAEKNNAPLPAVIAYNRIDSVKPLRILSDQISVFTLTDFIQQSLIATVPELTVMNFPALYARKMPFFILFLDVSEPASEAAKETLAKVAQSEEFENVIFCWMNAQAQTMGSKILSSYTITANLPLISVVDHRQGKVYSYQEEELSATDITEWLRRVLAEKEKPARTLEDGKWVNPGPHYDFLSFIDQMNGVSPLDLNIESEVEAQEFDDEENTGEFTVDSQLETLETDKDVREELLALHQSRSQGKKEKSYGHLKQSHTGHSHVEL